MISTNPVYMRIPADSESNTPFTVPKEFILARIHYGYRLETGMP